MRLSIAMLAASGCWTGAASPASAPIRAASAPAATAPVAALGQICDTADRIYVVDARADGAAVISERASSVPLAGTVTVISRSDGERRAAPIDAGSVDSDECGGIGGGHAGCSEQGGSTIHSAVLAGDTLVLGNYRSFKLLHGDSYRTCRDADGEPWLATCSTRSWFAIAFRGKGDVAQLAVYRGAGVSGWEPESPAFVEPAARAAGGRYAGQRATLVVGRTSGFVELDGAREPCLALHVE